MLLGALGGSSLYLLQALGSRQSLYFLVIVLTLGDPLAFEKKMRNLFLLEMRSYIKISYNEIKSSTSLSKRRKQHGKIAFLDDFMCTGKKGAPHENAR